MKAEAGKYPAWFLRGPDAGPEWSERLKGERSTPKAKPDTSLPRRLALALDQADDRGGSQFDCAVDAGTVLLDAILDELELPDRADVLMLMHDLPESDHFMIGAEGQPLHHPTAVRIALDALFDHGIAKPTKNDDGDWEIFPTEAADDLGRARTTLMTSEPVEEAPPSPLEVLRSRLLTIGQLRNLPPPKALVEDFLDLDSVAFGYGPRGCYKSFAVVDLGLSIATGTRWHGRQVTYGPVHYIVAEGLGGLAQRFDAWLGHHPLTNTPENFHVFPEPVNLLSPDRVGMFASVIAEMGTKFVIVDTLARCLVGGDENSAKDAGLAVEQLDVIRRRTGACVYVVHHSGKNAEAGARGSSAFEAAADTVHAYEGSDGLLTIRCTKQKNHAEHLPIHLRTVSVGESLALELNRGGLPDRVTTKELEVLVALDSVAGPDGASHGDWKAAAGDRKVSEGKFAAARKALMDRDLVTALDGRGGHKRYHLTAEGSAFLTEREAMP